MKSNIYNLIRLSAALLTVLLLALVQYLPERELSILKNPNINSNLYSETASQGKATIEWLDSGKGQWRCQHQPHTHISCGQVLTMKPILGNGINLSSFNSLRLKMWYEGDGKRFRIFMRNFENSVSRESDYSSTKFMSLLIKTRELNDGILDVEFNEFATAQWWTAKWDVSREDAKVAVNMIHTIGVDFIDAGDHAVQVVDIVAVGDWIKPEILYFAVLILWMMVIVGEGVVRSYLFHRHSIRSEKTIYALVNNNVKLTQEQVSLKERVGRDPLTGALNRDGLNQYREQLGATLGNASIGILLLDIDHFKNINDNYGHDVGDVVLKQLVSLIIDNSRTTDSFTRWGGEEFLLLCPSLTELQLMSIAEKLRSLVERFKFGEDTSLCVTISIGVALGELDQLEALIKHADTMLYAAKAGGRNQIKCS